MPMGKTTIIQVKKEADQTNVDQIREILFGTQEKQLNEKFESIEKESKKFQKEINSKIDLEVKKLSKKIKKQKLKQKKELGNMMFDMAVRLSGDKKIAKKLKKLENSSKKNKKI